MTAAPETVTVMGRRMAYRFAGDGPAVLLLHGNPTSSYLWRAVIPEVGAGFRCVAPDLIGMGGSDKLPETGDERYRFVHHREFLDAFVDAVLGDAPFVVVGHDWGGVLAMDLARRRPERIRGIGYLETMVAPHRSGTPTAPDPDFFGSLRSERGEQRVLQDNVFVEQILAVATSVPLDDEAMTEYRRPYLEPGEGRRPMLTWARQIPIDGSPADVAEIVTANGEFMAGSSIPKLFVNGDPGVLLVDAPREYCRSWPDQTEVTVPGGHFLPEDAGPEIGRALRDWLSTLG
ncbi:haloalkane dehalogenase [Nakamurella sp. YIM 132087]|uniref:Haloalkane dehalogenase n=1 Tax=Nakamurella alba TaxID=2665158 RepID=A0A7K1FP35_9ACTN|nr:haloalkane dehalogenase [Nakamurella alba]MTD15915.1 haloalkane dehalogenase [Nakamurella alba]